MYRHEQAHKLDLSSLESTMISNKQFAQVKVFIYWKHLICEAYIEKCEIYETANKCT